RRARRARSRGSRARAAGGGEGRPARVQRCRGYTRGLRLRPGARRAVVRRGDRGGVAARAPGSEGDACGRARWAAQPHRRPDSRRRVFGRGRPGGRAQGSARRAARACAGDSRVALRGATARARRCRSSTHGPAGRRAAPTRRSRGRAAPGAVRGGRARLDELQKLRTELTETVERRFTETFDAVQANFAEVAATLFPGGEGRLRLTESEDEEEQPGIEVELRPAGKRVQRLSLLSGGEKALGAIAFLFA